MPASAVTMGTSCEPETRNSLALKGTVGRSNRGCFEEILLGASQQRGKIRPSHEGKSGPGDVPRQLQTGVGAKARVKIGRVLGQIECRQTRFVECLKCLRIEIENRQAAADRHFMTQLSPSDSSWLA